MAGVGLPCRTRLGGGPRVTATVAALTAAIVAASGCGAGTRPSRTQALSYAERVGLRQGDLPGESGVGRGGPFNGATLGVIVNRCGAEIPASAELAAAISPTFVDTAPGPNLYRDYRRWHVYSFVYVLRSESEAKRAVAALRLSLTRRCMAAAYSAAHPGGNAVRATVRPITLRVAGEQVGGVAETGRQGAHLRFEVDTLAFARGQAVFRVQAAGTRGAPFAATERRAVEVLLSRSRQLSL